MRWIGKSRKYRTSEAAKANARTRRDKVNSFIAYGLIAGMLLLAAILIPPHLEKSRIEWEYMRQEMEQKDKADLGDSDKRSSTNQLRPPRNIQME